MVKNVIFIYLGSYQNIYYNDIWLDPRKVLKRVKKEITGFFFLLKECVGSPGFSLPLTEFQSMTNFCSEFFIYSTVVSDTET